MINSILKLNFLKIVSKEACFSTKNKNETFLRKQKNKFKHLVSLNMEKINYFNDYTVK
jgi:hypothetical protein